MKKLAIIGAGYLQLPLVLKAKEMGIETHCFAWPDGAVCEGQADYFYPISILEKEAIFRECEKIDIDGITTIATDMAVPTVCFVAEKLNLISNSVISGNISTNKWEMRKVFKAQNCSTPRFMEIESEIKNIPDFNFPLIVKPVDRSGSRGVTKVNTQEELPNAISYALNESFAKKALVEEFIEGREVSVESISWNGAHTILAITDKVTTGAPYFVELAHHQPTDLSDEIQDKIKKETLKCLEALQIKNGAGHSEFKIDSSGEVFVIEVGARMGGDFIGSHLVQLSTGYDFVKAVIDVALNQFKPDFSEVKKYAGVYFLCKETEHLTPYFNKGNDFEVQKEILNEELQYITNSNDRSGYLIYQSNERIQL